MTVVGNIMETFKLMIKWQIMITTCANIVISRFANRYTFYGLMTYDFIRSYAFIPFKLKTDSNKNPASSHFFNISFNTINFRRTAAHQDFFETFLSFSIVSFRHKWNRIGLILVQTKCTSYIMSCQIT